MTQRAESTNPETGRMMLPLAVVGLSLWHAFPSLFEAWSVDLYARGAASAFVIWLAILGIPSICKKMLHEPFLAWSAISLVLIALGAMTEIRAVHHLALAFAVTGTMGLKISGLLSVAAAITWMPAAGWVISHWKTDGLVGWERPTIALFMISPLAVISCRSSQRAKSRNS